VDGLDTYHAWKGIEMFIHFWMECLKGKSQLEEIVVDVKMKIKLALSK
jgi:hypothetical protein